VECTSSLIQALILFKGVHPGYRREEIDRIIKNGVLFIEKKQKNDGSWYAWCIPTLVQFRMLCKLYISLS
jgi:squalene cyclase